MFIHCVPKLLSDRNVPVFCLFVFLSFLFYILLLSSIDVSVFFVFPSYNGTTVEINNMFSMN